MKAPFAGVASLGDAFHKLREVDVFNAALGKALAGGPVLPLSAPIYHKFGCPILSRSLQKGGIARISAP